MEENCQLFDGLLSKLFKLVMFQSLVSLLGLVFEILSSSTTFFKPIHYNTNKFRKLSKSSIWFLGVIMHFWISKLGIIELLY